MTDPSGIASPSRRKIIAIHQPNYIPWLGYFYKMAHCDIFVYLDTVQYPRGQSFSPRNRIKTPNGVQYLTIPIRTPEGKQGKVKFNEVSFADEKWKQKHLRTIEMNYGRAPYFEQIFELYKAGITSADRFLDLNINLIESFATYLDIKTERIRLSELLNEVRGKTLLIVDICKALEVDTYLSGQGGGREYNDETILDENGIELIYSDFRHPVYPQLWGEFEPGLSIIDLLFNCGLHSKAFLE